MVREGESPRRLCVCLFMTDSTPTLVHARVGSAPCDEGAADDLQAPAPSPRRTVIHSLSAPRAGYPTATSSVSGHPLAV